MRAKIGVVIALAVLVAVPTVAGQASSANVRLDVAAPFPDIVVPEVGVLSFRVKVGVSCVPQDLLTAAGSRTIVSFAIKSASAASSVAVLPQSISETYTEQECASQSYMKDFAAVYTVSLTRGAVAFQDQPIRLAVAVMKTGQAGVYHESKHEAALNVRADFLPQTMVSPVILFQKAPPESKITFPVEITNLANGASRVRIDAVAVGGNPVEAVQAGPEVRLESRAERGEAAIYKDVRVIEVITPPVGGIASIAATFTTQYDGVLPDGSQGLTDETQVTFAAQVAGVKEMGGTVPGASVVVVLASLGLAAVAARRLR